jgi:geranylgeranyl diphosphate synthase type I
MPTAMRYNSHMTFADYLSSRRAYLAQYLQKFISREERLAGDELSDIALERLADFSTKGKMLRGTFVMLGYEMFTEIDNSTPEKNEYTHEDVLRVAVAMELSQAAILIHDDIMDNDRTRRGNKTIFAHYAEDAAYHNISIPDEYGKSMAMIVGDAGLFLTYELIGSIDVDPAIRSRIMNRYSKEMLKTCLGQFLDYHYGKTTQERSLDEIKRMYHLKTRSYTFTLPLMMGAYLAGKTDDELTVLEEIATYMGEVFQIKDDELGLFGDATKTGKAVGSDIAEDKKTLFRAELFNNATPEEKSQLQNIFGKLLSEENVKYVQELLESYGIRKNLQEKVQINSKKAHELLAKLSISDEARNLFRELVDYNGSRGA